MVDLVHHRVYLTYRIVLAIFYTNTNPSFMEKIRVLVVGCGNMGSSAAIAYENHPGFEICGLVFR